MEKIKIISNPYKKEIKFQNWNDENNCWTTINKEEHGNSKLISQEITTGFFPFKVKKIVDIIISEYRNGDDKLEILFEGTDDEFDELVLLCNDDYYKDIVSVSQSKLLLENARDILPKIKGMFKDIRNLVYDSVTDKTQVDIEFNRLTEASDDIIPICVLGNYSCGKSTFINALIGYEILPSGADPVTAKIFKISKSNHADRATVSFEFGTNPITISFMEKKYRIDGEITDSSLLNEIEGVLEDYIDEALDERVYNTLDIINTFEDDDTIKAISDLINVSVPFRAGLWGETQNNFVIFDTPGSNSASNETHLTVLKKALGELSNGIIIFISKYDTLDSIDNENLYLEINNMKELDSRFTMIVVNQADSAEIPKNHERKILKQAVPKKLHSDNILFISSIMGLGFKNDNIFINEHCAEIFDEKYPKYNNPSAKFYKQLYKYNIMPEQLKKKAIERSDNYKDKVYSNSGLYCIEDEIQTFASKYSSYNKCQQSLMFLRKISMITSDEIANTKEQTKKAKDDIEKNLEREMVILRERVESKANDLLNEYLIIYPDLMVEKIKNSKHVLSKEELYSLEEDFIKEQEEIFDYDDKEYDAKKSIHSLKDNLIENVQNAIKKLDMDSLKNVVDDVADDINKIVDTNIEKRIIKKEVDKAASNNLLEHVKQVFKEHSELAKNNIDSDSKEYWEEKVKNIKDELSTLIADSEELSKEKRDELAEIIITYDDIVFENNVDDIFQKTYLEDKFRIDYIFFGESVKLNKNKLMSKYNEEMDDALVNLYAEINNSHITSFKNWLNNLLFIVNDNIVDYSPVLHRQQLIVKNLNDKIAELESKQKKLDIYDKKIESMMEWKEN